MKLRIAILAFALSLGGTISCGPKATTVTVPGSLNNTDAQISYGVTQITVEYSGRKVVLTAKEIMEALEGK